MDINDLRGLSTIFCMLAFAAVCFWAYGPSRKEYFNKASQLPFEDEKQVPDVAEGGDHK